MDYMTHTNLHEGLTKNKISQVGVGWLKIARLLLNL